MPKPRIVHTLHEFLTADCPECDGLIGVERADHNPGCVLAHIQTTAELEAMQRERGETS